MKSLAFLSVCILTGTVAVGELSQSDLERLQRTVSIDSVRTESYRDNNRNEFKVLKFNTSQYESEKIRFYIRVTVEMKANGNLVYAQQIRRKGDITNTEYIGQDRWEFYIPLGEYSSSRITAYVIEYGIMDNERFISVATATSRVKSREEIIERCQVQIEDNVELKHAYVYRDESLEEEEDELQSEMVTLTE
jgi:hypothetical protein